MNRRRFQARVILSAAVALGIWPPTVAESQRRPETPPPSIVDRVAINTARPIDFHAMIWPDTAYVGQQVHYQVGVFLSEDARARLRRDPEYLPPELRGLMTYELIAPRRVGSVIAGGVRYDAHVFQRPLFPVVGGEVTVPAPQLSYSLPRSSSYFSREESYVVRAESARLIVRDLPETGRPADFTGAVGRFTSSASFDDKEPRVGEPLILTLRVDGIGNIKMLPRPPLELPWASVVPGSERYVIDSLGVVIRGAKLFDWILTPTREGPLELPSIRYAYFDPYARQYEVALSAPVAFSVAPGEAVMIDESEGGNTLLALRDSLGMHTVVSRVGMWRSAVPDAVWYSLLALAPLPALALLLLGAPRAARRSVEVPPSDLTVLAARSSARSQSGEATSPVDSAREVRRALHNALAKRLGVKPQHLTDRRQLSRMLRRRGATRPAVASLMSLLEKLDRVGFGGEQALASETFAIEARDLFAKIEQETFSAPPAARSHTAQASALLFVSWQLLGEPVEKRRAVEPSQDSAIVADFNAAREAYAQRRFGEATSRFATLSERAPNESSILTNWGTSAWTLGDTVSAVIAWHRAIRLDPVAADVQQRLALLPAGARGGVADVSLLATPMLFVSGVFVWCTGWLIFAFYRLRRRKWMARFPLARDERMSSHVLRNVGVVAIACGGIGVGVAAWDERAHDVHSLYVVTRPETMRASGRGDADASGGVSTGDVVKMLGYEQNWVHVEHADGRTGWLPMARLRQIDPVGNAVNP